MISIIPPTHTTAFASSNASAKKFGCYLHSSVTCTIIDLPRPTSDDSIYVLDVRHGGSSFFITFWSDLVHFLLRWWVNLPQNWKRQECRRTDHVIRSAFATLLSWGCYPPPASTFSQLQGCSERERLFPKQPQPSSLLMECIGQFPNRNIPVEQVVSSTFVPSFTIILSIIKLKTSWA